MTLKGIEPGEYRLSYLSISVERVFKENYNLVTKWMELLQKFRQRNIVMNRKQDVTRWFVREAVESAAVNVKENGKEDKWSY